MPAKSLAFFIQKIKIGNIYRKFLTSATTQITKAARPGIEVCRSFAAVPSAPDLSAGGH